MKYSAEELRGLGTLTESSGRETASSSCCREVEKHGERREEGEWGRGNWWTLLLAQECNHMSSFTCRINQFHKLSANNRALAQWCRHILKVCKMKTRLKNVCKFFYAFEWLQMLEKISAHPWRELNSSTFMTLAVAVSKLEVSDQKRIVPICR